MIEQSREGGRWFDPEAIMPGRGNDGSIVDARSSNLTYSANRLTMENVESRLDPPDPAG